MPYKEKSDLPENVKHSLPSHAQDIYKEAFNHAWEEYKSSESRRESSSQEEVSHKVAWSAVKNKYEKSGESWVKRN